MAGDDICPPYVLNSKPFYSRCLPAIISDVVDGATNGLTATDNSGSNIQITDESGTSITDTSIKQGAQYVVSLMNLKTVYQSILEDFTRSGYLIGTLLAIGAVATFVYILILRWILGELKKIRTNIKLNHLIKE